MTSLQESFVLLVHIKKKKIRLREIEITAISGAIGENAKHMLEALEGYQDMVFPGMEKEKKFEDKAREILATETEKAFVLKRSSNPIKAAKDGIKKRGYATSLDSHYMKNKKKYDHRAKIREAMEKK